MPNTEVFYAEEFIVAGWLITALLLKIDQIWIYVNGYSATVSGEDEINKIYFTMWLRHFAIIFRLTAI